ncbi:putative ankyrin repeat protein RF_0381 [Chelonus insularis]|uniref:putative ankyrin repeat protein RF_0381 n=1 Tax=Chelonus insularis TaxID=460826 RepID=UPI00158CCB84|nr:putative ankyrin repeat protein RF_0381 [Chelonus insularis]XP_034943190.1 putative ankyrin repeat protein RF_0381 [Chelonus insularis]
MSQKKSNQNEDFKPLIQKAIHHQDTQRVANLIKKALRNKIDIDLTEELGQAVALGNKHLVELIYPFSREIPRLVPKIAILKKGQKYINCLQFLLDNGFTIKPRDPDLKVYMHTLISEQCDNVFIKLMNHDIDVNLVDDRTGYFLIHTACIANRMKIVKYLIQRNADVNAKTTSSDGSIRQSKQLEGKTALYFAIEACNIPMIKFLLKHGADPNASCDILAGAVVRQNKEIIRILLDNGADVHLTSEEYLTPLHYCVSDLIPNFSDTARSEIIKMFLEKKADVNAETLDGRTPLREATRNGYAKVIKVLMEYGANLDTPNGNNFNYSFNIH